MATLYEVDCEIKHYEAKIEFLDLLLDAYETLGSAKLNKFEDIFTEIKPIFICNDYAEMIGCYLTLAFEKNIGRDKINTETGEYISEFGSEEFQKFSSELPSEIICMLDNVVAQIAENFNQTVDWHYIGDWDIDMLLKQAKEQIIYDKKILSHAKEEYLFLKQTLES
jgi:hypothetical protein